LVTPEYFRAWAPAPREVTTCSYQLAEMVGAAPDADFFHPVDAPAAFQHEAPDYRKWSARVHRAAGAGSR